MLNRFIFLGILTLFLTTNVFSQCSDIFFSEYVDGDTTNNVLELYNPSVRDTIYLNNYVIYRNDDGSAIPTDSFYMNDTIAPRSVYVIGDTAASSSITNIADTLHSISTFNGNDAIWIKNLISGDTIDIIGEIGVNPDSGWIVGTGFTDSFTLVRNSLVNGGQTDWLIGTTEWSVLPFNTFDSLGNHSKEICDCGWSQDSFPMVACNIDTFVSPSGKIWDSVGVYYDTIPNAIGCDSFITIALSFDSTSADTFAVIACDSFVSPSGIYTWYASDTVMDTILNAGGCDSFMTIYLTILNSTSSTVDTTVVGCYIGPDGYARTSSGQDTAILTNAVGCDSFIFINIIIDSSDIIGTFKGNSFRLVQDVNIGGSGSNPSNIFEFNGNLYFTGTDGTGTELWQYNGDSISLVDEIAISGNAILSNEFYEFDSAIYFSANDGLNGFELWKYDGDTIVMVDNTSEFGDANPNKLITFDSTLYFRADDGFITYGLYKLDSAGKPELVKNGKPFTSNGGIDYIVFDNELYFVLDDDTVGVELWKTNGDTTMLVKDINPLGSSTPSEFIIFEEEFYFTADNGTNGTELWKISGDSALMVIDLFSGVGSSSPLDFTIFLNKLYFTAHVNPFGRELWYFDGDTFVLTQNIHPASSAFSPTSQESRLVRAVNELIFKATNGVHGNELWEYDGEKSTLLANIHPSSDANPATLTSFEKEVYFKAKDHINGIELWKYSDGDISRISDINTSGDAFLPTDVFNILPFGRDLYFSASNGKSGQELWELNTCFIPDTLDETVCFSYTSPSGRYTWTKSGIYHDTIYRMGKCDSIFHITLNITSVDLSVTTMGDTLIAEDSGATYQWLKCDSNITTIGGETNQSFIANESGDYAVIVERNGCADTSDCYSIIKTVIDNIEQNISIYPNPTSDFVTIASQHNNGFTIKLKDISGKLIIQKRTTSRKTNLDLKAVLKGIYILEIESDQGRFYQKVFKQ